MSRQRLGKIALAAIAPMLWSWNLAAAADLFGDDILKKSQQAYLAIQSYSGSTTVTHKMVVGAGTITQTGSARISFVRPGLIRIEGKDSQRQPFSIVSNGAETWLGWALQHDGQFRKVENLEVAVSAMTGVGVQAPTIIPAALLPLGWGLPWTATAGATLVGQESIGGVNCYKVVVQVPPGSPMSGTRTFWVDSQLFLLRKFQEERDEQDLARMQSELR